MTRSFLRGRRRPPAPLHLLATRELSMAMRQLRVAAGDDVAGAAVILNQTITGLYPDAAPTASAGRPHLVTESFLRTVEKGHHSRLDVYQLPKWLDVTKFRDRTQLYASRVPEWLVRAYDVAFCADGYLVDMFAWSAAFLPDQLRDVPRRLRDLPAHLPEGREHELFAASFPEPDERIDALLRTQAGLAAALRDRPPNQDVPWQPAPGDESTAHDETPEGQLVAPGGRFVAAWELRNSGSVPWRDRVLYRVGAYPGSVGTPPFVVVPDLDPGETARVECPMRAPDLPGTYRACLKMGWPDGTYCFPSTLLGLFVTIVVPPGDLTDPEREWADHAG